MKKWTNGFVVEKYNKYKSIIIIGDDVATTVKLSEKSKKKLDRLQAEIFLKSSKNFTKQQLLEKIIELSTEDKGKLLEKFVLEISYPLKKQEIHTIMSSSIDWGVKTKEEDLDKTLYGE